MSDLSYKSSKLMHSSSVATGRHTGRQTPGRVKTEIVVGDRKLNSLPGERRGRLVRGRQGRQREISPKETAGESCMEAKNNLAVSV